VWRRACWLLVVYVAAVAATPPVIAAANGASDTAKVRPLAGEMAAPMSSLARAAADDLSGPTALGAFRLSQPPARLILPLAGRALPVAGSDRFVSGERGPPPPVH
jgi:hypothetical protein